MLLQLSSPAFVFILVYKLHTSFIVHSVDVSSHINVQKFTFKFHEIARINGEK